MSREVVRHAAQLAFVKDRSLIARARQGTHDKLLVDLLPYPERGPISWLEFSAADVDRVLELCEPNDHEAEAKAAEESGGQFGDIEFGTHLGLRAEALAHPDGWIVMATCEVVAPEHHRGPGRPG